MGPLFIDFSGTELTSEDRQLLKDVKVGGVILFSENYTDIKQLMKLTADIRACAARPILIGVDHEGGRVQRFQKDFTFIPAMGDLIQDDDPEELAKICGWLAASELISAGIDLSLGPVLDLNRGSCVIGTRSFHTEPEQVIRLASMFILGMKEAGMACVAKHFPGHGSVVDDTHVDVVSDTRSQQEIFATDMHVFTYFVQQKNISAIMPAHVTYSDVDPLPAGFSSHWLKTILREKIGFDGVVMSDDLSMVGASYFKNMAARAHAALAAGCDLLLACHDRPAIWEILASLPEDCSCQKARTLLKKQNINRDMLLTSPDWYNARQRIEHFLLTHESGVFDSSRTALKASNP